MGHGDGYDPQERLEAVIREHLANAPDQLDESADVARLCAKIVESVSAARDVHIHINIYPPAPASVHASGTARAIVRPLQARAAARTN